MLEAKICERVSRYSVNGTPRVTLKTLAKCFLKQPVSAASIIFEIRPDIIDDSLKVYI